MEAEKKTEIKETDNKNIENDIWVSELIDLVKSQCRRWAIAFFVVLGLWAATIGGFIWYLNQYDFTSYSQDGDGNNYMNSDIEGDVHNGAEIPNTKEKEPE